MILQQMYGNLNIMVGPAYAASDVNILELGYSRKKLQPTK